MTEPVTVTVVGDGDGDGRRWPRLLAAAGLLALAAPALAAPLTLDEALAMAARNNADLLAARADRDAARADVGTARAAVLPRLDLTAAVGKQAWGDSVVTSYGVSYQQPAGNSGDHALQLQATQPLLDVARFRALEQAGHGARASERAVDEAALRVAFQVTQRFYELLKQERSLAVLRGAAARSGEQVGRADALFTAGRTPRSETFSARVNLKADQLAVEQQELRLVQARLSLGTALGWAGPEPLEVAAPPELDAPLATAPEPPPLEDLLALARRRRPTLAAEEARTAAARAGIGAARAGDYPSLALQGTYSRSSTELGGRDGAFGDPSRSYLAAGQVVLSWNLFEGFGTRAAVRKAEAGLARAEAEAARSRTTVVEEVAGARAAVAALARQQALAAQNVQVARDALQLATERFNAGLATQLEERDASVKLSQAELTLVEARIDHAVARADLARAVGGAL